jgi:hypothetical protein
MYVCARLPMYVCARLPDVDEILIANEIADEAKIKKKNCLYLKWILRSHMIWWNRITYFLLCKRCR